MPDTPITPILAEISEMQDSFVQPACQMDQEPMIKYPDTGTPPTLSFNIPQATIFNTYGKMAVPLTEELLGYFREFTTKIPTNNYWSVIQNMTPDQIFQLMNPMVANPAPVMAYYPINHAHMGAADMASMGHPVTTAQHAGPGAQSGSLKSQILNTPMQNNTATAGPFSPDYGVMPVYMQQVSPTSTKSVIAGYAAQGLRPVFVTRISGEVPVTKYVAKPPTPKPQLFIVEEYTTGSYLGNYGAGRVVKTFTLLPGERTTISVRTYKDMESKRESAQNMLDSFSESSANELDKLIQHEDGNMTSDSQTSSDSSSNFNTHTDANNSSSSFGLSAGVNFGLFNASGGYGMSNSDASSNANGWNSAAEHGYTGSRQSNVSNLNNALSKHVQQSNASRQININTSTTDTAKSGEEDTTIRYIENYNKSRVLNFTFRQLLQEYITITSLTNLKFVYTNGYPESFTIVDLNNLDNMLLDIIKDGDPDAPVDPHPIEYFRDKFRCLMLRPYCTVLDYQGDMQPFLSRKKIEADGCEDPDRIEDWSFLDVCGEPKGPEYFWRIYPDLDMVYDPTTSDPPHIGMDLHIPGVILSAKKQTLQTSSVIGDALMGRGQALDCFNQKAQEADNMAAFINNVSAMQRVSANIQEASDTHDTITQQMDVITAVSTPADQVAGYKKVFGDCCPTPQYTGGCGCGSCTD